LGRLKKKKTARIRKNSQSVGQDCNSGMCKKCSEIFHLFPSMPVTLGVKRIYFMKSVYCKFEFYGCCCSYD